MRTHLIAGKRGKELLATVLYETSTTADWFNDWFKHHLLKELKPASTLIMDNAAFHKKTIITEIAHNAGHHVLFLPPALFGRVFLQQCLDKFMKFSRIDTYQRHSTG